MTNREFLKNRATHLIPSPLIIYHSFLLIFKNNNITDKREVRKHFRFFENDCYIITLVII